ncbi:MAG: peptidase T, partial [Oligoflexales bacterium]|nr:peptidase T [Oligoflexales bacterium]
LAHMDVASDCRGEGVRPIVHKNYDGGELCLPSGLKITPEENPELLKCLGETIITSDGTTLLGADDKAGIAEIMTMIEILMKSPGIKHPELRICFTPDEEIGKGVDKIDMKKLDADFGFTVDGGFPCELNYENFDAYNGKITFKGISFHPGAAKGKMVNAVRYGGMFIDMLPHSHSPENTSMREPFIHPLIARGDVSEFTVDLIIRGFSLDDIERQKKMIMSIIDHIKSVEPRIICNVNIKESYRNMADIISKNGFILDSLLEAGRKLGLDPYFNPIRGGTDGARLSYMGLPCPNIFTGGVNFHSPKEWISHEKMALTTAFLLEIVQNI